MPRPLPLLAAATPCWLSPRSEKSMKILFVNLPQRFEADNFPPYGALAVMTALRRAGYNDLFFYNMDVLRPTRQQALAFISELKPDVLAISSPVSTGYEGCRFFSLEVKKRLPGITIVLGGNLAASAEIILTRTGVDFCVLGEGEIACRRLLDAYWPNRRRQGLSQIKGLAYLDGERLIVTGYGEQLPAEQIFDVDWDLLDPASATHYFPSIRSLDPSSSLYRYFFPDSAHGDRFPDDRIKKRIGVFCCSKGCFNRCTFCHRFVKGLRVMSPEQAVARIRAMVDRFDLGALQLSDECFGASAQWLRRFCTLIGPMNLLWKVGGMRVDVVSPELLALMRDSGCRTVIYGMESGSDAMLRVMEKKADVGKNLQAARWTAQAGIHSVLQLVIGMPGESPETIAQTARFAGRFVALHANQNPNEISINFAQALPGTPLYEYARRTGRIGPSSDAEENYLLAISDQNASDGARAVNFTDYPRTTLLAWPWQIRATANHAYVRRFGIKRYARQVWGGKTPSLSRLLRASRWDDLFIRYPRFFYRCRLLFKLVGLTHLLRRGGIAEALRALTMDFSVFRSGSVERFVPCDSLRKILFQRPYRLKEDNPAMTILRNGR